MSASCFNHVDVSFMPFRPALFLSFCSSRSTPFPEPFFYLSFCSLVNQEVLGGRGEVGEGAMEGLKCSLCSRTFPKRDLRYNPVRPCALAATSFACTAAGHVAYQGAAVA